MERKEQFDWAVSVLVKAYFEGTLDAMNCAACAVGNLIAARNGYSINGWLWEKDGEGIFPVWGAIRNRPYYNDSDKSLGLLQAKSTGYSNLELERIEEAFMYDMLHDAIQDNFDGLMAVVDVLCDIHKCHEVKEETKALFAK